MDEVNNGLIIRSLKYVGSFALLLSWTLTALGYFPYNLIAEAIGASCWLVVGVTWRNFGILYLNTFLFTMSIKAMFTNGLIGGF